MRSEKNFWAKCIIIIVVLTCLTMGCAQQTKQQTLKKPTVIYSIKTMEGRPCISINVENLKPPFTVSLLGPDKHTLDFKYVEYKNDLPAILYFGLSDNVRPGRYYLRVEKFGNLILEKTLNLSGSKVSIVDCKFNFSKEEFLGYELKTLIIRLKGVGDCPAYPYYVYLHVNGDVYSGIVSNYKTPTLPGKIQTYTVRDFLCYLKKGHYRVKLVIQGFGGLTLGEKTMEVNVP